MAKNVRALPLCDYDVPDWNEYFGSSKKPNPLVTFAKNWLWGMLAILIFILLWPPKNRRALRVGVLSLGIMAWLRSSTKKPS
jgi:hypothetical protein